MQTYEGKRAAIQRDITQAEAEYQVCALAAEEGDTKALQRLKFARNAVEVQRSRLLDLEAAASAAQRQRATADYQRQTLARRDAHAAAEALSVDLVAAAAALDAAACSLGDAHARVVDLAGRFCSALAGAADARGRDSLDVTALGSDHVLAALVDALAVAGLGALVGVQVPDTAAPRLADLARSRCARALALIDLEDSANAA